jgi:hypothetical protein
MALLFVDVYVLLAGCLLLFAAFHVAHAVARWLRRT